MKRIPLLVLFGIIATSAQLDAKSRELSHSAYPKANAAEAAKHAASKMARKKSQSAQPSFNGIPDKFQGVYDLAWRKCQSEESDRMHLSADKIAFHDDRNTVDLSASVKSAILAPDGTLVTLSEYNGREARWLAIDGFSLSSDGQKLIRTTSSDFEKEQSRIEYARCDWKSQK